MYAYCISLYSYVGDVLCCVLDGDVSPSGPWSFLSDW